MSVSLSDFWMILTGVTVGVTCGVLGAFLVLRRLALLGDAVSHALLPGIVAAFIFSGTRDPLIMLAGALIAGLMTAGISAMLTRYARVAEDASLGVVFTVMFALGVVLLLFVPRGLDLDPGCVLYGLLEYVSIQRQGVLGFQVPSALLVLLPMCVVSLLLVVVFFKELKLVSFDPALATAMGFAAGAVQVGLLALISANVVTSFQAVGSILVVALLAAPGATAQLLTVRLWKLLVLSGFFGASAAIIGCLLAIEWNTSAAGMIAVIAGVQFAVAFVLSPSQGLVGKGVRRWRLGLRIAREDLLASLFRQWELSRGQRAELPVATPTLRPSLVARYAKRQLIARGLLHEVEVGTLRLTETGMVAAREIVRRHRLWETYLAQNTPLPTDHLHEPSHRLEHFGVPEVPNAEVDPHGRRIPPP